MTAGTLFIERKNIVEILILRILERLVEEAKHQIPEEVAFSLHIGTVLQHKFHWLLKRPPQ